MSNINISNRLCNPTPFQVVWPYDKGVKLVIPADGHLDLDAMVMDDFRSDKPGHEAVKAQMDQYGIFLRDPTRPYEHQALESLGCAIRSLDGMYQDTYNNLRRRAAAQGTYDQEAFEETLEQMGYGNLKRKVEALKERLVKYESAVSERAVVHEEFDPKRTLLFLDPPKEFDSEIAMEVYLAENEDVRAQQDAFVAAQEAMAE